jgi:hypothetical protein
MSEAIVNRLALSSTVIGITGVVLAGVSIAFWKVPFVGGIISGLSVTGSVLALVLSRDFFIAHKAASSYSDSVVGKLDFAKNEDEATSKMLKLAAKDTLILNSIRIYVNEKVVYKK